MMTPRKNKSKFDPYGTLDLDKSASPGAVKGAFRRRAKKAHPDLGGSAEEFAEVNRAYLLLSDETRRHRFDTTGAVDEPQPDLKLQNALGMIAGMLGSILEGEAEPTESALVDAMRKHLSQQIEEAHKRVKQPKAFMRRAEKLHGRFKKKNGENQIEGMLKNLAGEARRVFMKIEHEIEVAEMARDILADYTFTPDMPPLRPTPMAMWMAASTSTT